MREIKFRAWDKQYGMLSGDDIEELHDEIVTGLSCGELYVARKSDYENDFREFKVMQFTGMKDKNGLEIYENDILKGRYWEYGKERRFIGEVVFGSHGFWLMGVKQYKGMRQEFNSLYEILGNSFENKELLNAEVS